ncbi:hypothetical protein [Lachnoclostridium sp. Marseille-P6806]|uniref:hypothetical protein n=1 Tax=Lachnoclostridium sp. Marseille-P6806 TaxID=2364793 RepID=UPI00102F7A61|nr:hypothetical protein [Lachnoclostridium sp. Marseille-P6806]
MRNSVIRLIYAAVLFAATVFLLELLMHQGSAAITAEMDAASLPLIRMETVGRTVNELHGFTAERDISHYRTVLTPMGEDRAITFTVELYGEEVTGLSFELRSVDGGRLIEDGAVMREERLADGRIEAGFTVKDLIAADTEYMLVILLDRADGSAVRYYTRVMECDETAISAELAFAQQFHDGALSGQEGGTVSQVIETSTEGDNSSFADVTIHSNFYQVTYGDLQPVELMRPVVAIQDLHEESCVLRMDYILSIDMDGNNAKFDCTEYYRLKRGTDRVYLMDYRRTMEEVFDPSLEENYVSDMISLGITEKEMQFVESDGGSALAFVNAGRLYGVTPSSAEVAQVFAFGAADSLDERDNYRSFGIRILDVDETGSIDFLVYGYMNRGEHEGELGTTFYTYNGEYHTVEELAFLPYSGSYDLLRLQVEKLSYYNNKKSTLFLLIDETIYEVNVAEHTVKTAADSLSGGGLQASASGQIVAWKSQDRGRGDSEDIISVMDFSTSGQQVIRAPAGERVVPLGFIHEDLIYGVAREADITTNAAGDEVLSMYAVYIVDSGMEELEHYEAGEYYVSSCEVNGDRITLHRVRRSDEDGQLVTAEDDQILTSDSRRQGANHLSEIVVERYETMQKISMRGFRASSVKFLEPKFVIHEGSRALALPELSGTRPERCFVYDMYGLAGFYLTPSEAVQKAEELSGCVLDDTGRYIWVSGNRRASNQIMAITEEAPEGGAEDSLAACLDMIFRYENTAVSAEQELAGSNNLLRILEEAIPGTDSYNLAGCSLDSVLYYVSEEKPVLALSDGGNRAALIAGYNSSIVVVVDPAAGSVERMPREAAEEKFTKGGGYVCYRMRAE